MIVTSKIRCSISIAPTSSRPAAGTFRQRSAKQAAAVSGFVVLTCLSNVCFADTQIGGTLPPPPDKLYGDLFVAVQTGQIYPDQKTFVDATPNADPAAIVQLYEQQKNNPGFSLASFVNQYFTPPSEPVITPPPNQTLSNDTKSSSPKDQFIRRSGQRWSTLRQFLLPQTCPFC
jgi:alpha,alpha-trehalase